MVKDTLRLNPPAELYLDKCLDDLKFIDQTLDYFTKALIEKSGGDNDDFDSVLDMEWQFNQLLTEFFLDTCPFTIKNFPDIQGKINSMRHSSNQRRKDLEETGISSQNIQMEPGVTSFEMNSLLGGT